MQYLIDYLYVSDKMDEARTLKDIELNKRLLNWYIDKHQYAGSCIVCQKHNLYVQRYISFLLEKHRKIKEVINASK
jgi:hypothetical protein